MSGVTGAGAWPVTPAWILAAHSATPAPNTLCGRSLGPPVPHTCHPLLAWLQFWASKQMPVSPESLSVPFLRLPSQSTKRHMEEMVAVIEGMDGNGKTKSLKVLFLPPVVSVTFSTFPVSQGEHENALRKLKLSSLNDCSDLQTTDAKCPVLPPAPSSPGSSSSVQ